MSQSNLQNPVPVSGSNCLLMIPSVTGFKVISGSVRVQTEYVSEELYGDRAALLAHVSQKYGGYDALLDVRAINPAV